MIPVKIDEIYFIIIHYEDLSGLQILIPNLLNHGAKKIGIYDGPFHTFKGGTGQDISSDGSIGYLNHQNPNIVEIHKMGRCWMEQKITAAFARAGELGFKYAMILGCDERLEGDFTKFGIGRNDLHVAIMPFREENPDQKFNRKVVMMHRFFINPGQLKGDISHYEYFVKGSKERIKKTTLTNGMITIHHNDKVRSKKRNSDMEKYQVTNRNRENQIRSMKFEELKKVKIYLGIPNTGQINSSLAVWLINVQNNITRIPNFEGPLGIDLRINRPVDNTRNIIVKSFLESDCTHLLMIDYDIVPPIDLIERLLMANKDIIVPKLPVWMGPEKGLSYASHNNKKSINWQKGINKVHFVGTGCILIKRKVFEKLPKPYFKFITDHEGIMVKPEDNYFSKLAQKGGFELFVNCDITVKHVREVELTELDQFYGDNKQIPFGRKKITDSNSPCIPDQLKS